MKFLRLELRNYRGITASVVTFAPLGVTVVRGPNEVGKSSIAEALHVLFKFKDSSKNSEVTAIRPVDKDESPEIELEAESGPYRFTYTKRFLRGRSTTLRIDAPKRESLTGDEAHARAEAILEETLDVALWKALSVLQGKELSLPALKDQQQLSQSLDRAAGGAQSSEREESLFGAATAEFLAYFYEGGRPRKEFEVRLAGIVKARAQVDELRTKLASLEHDIAESGRLQAELSRLGSRHVEAVQGLAQHEQRWAALEALDNRRREALVALETAKRVLQEARTELVARNALVDEAKSVQRRSSALAEAISAAMPTLAAAHRALELELEESTRAREHADRTAGFRQRRANDVELLRNVRRKDELSLKLAAVEKVRDAAVRAEQILAQNTLTGAVFAGLEKIANQLAIEELALTLAAPSVRIEARSLQVAWIDGVETKLASAEIVERSVPRALDIDVPGVISIRIQSGTGSEARLEKRDELRTKFAEACITAGARDLDEARARHSEFTSARQTVEERDRRLHEILDGASIEACERELAQLRLRVDVAQRERGAASTDVPLIATSIESAIALVDDSERAETDAKKIAKVVEARVAHTRRAHETLAQTQRDRERDRERELRDLAEFERRLASERAFAGDAEVVARAARAEIDLATVTTEHAESERLWQAQDAEGARARLTGARAALESIQRDVHAVKLEAKRIETALLLQGELGLGEALEAARADLDRQSVDAARFERRARAAKTLFEALRDERDAARRAYVAPLQTQVSRLARLVFPGELALEVSDDLAITSRTLAGVTVPFESLSGGTREQLSILMRLAVAMIVSGDQGVPVVFDDTLGYTDEDRLERMAAAFALAGETCQVIVLTCVPDRFRHVPNAHVVTLGRG